MYWTIGSRMLMNRLNLCFFEEKKIPVRLDSSIGRVVFLPNVFEIKKLSVQLDSNIQLAVGFFTSVK